MRFGDIILANWTRQQGRQKIPRIKAAHCLKIKQMSNMEPQRLTTFFTLSLTSKCTVSLNIQKITNKIVEKKTTSNFSKLSET